MKLFRVLLFVFSFYTIVLEARSQPPAGRPAIGRVTGVVIDDLSKKPIEFATVSLIRVKDQGVENGVIANERGYFVMEQVRVGIYVAKISFIGYTSLITDTLRIMPQSPEINLGTIKLKIAAKNLDEAIVSGERGVMQMAIDKKVFNVDKNLVSNGGNANDILQNIPSVDVDVNGNISLRGSGNVTVLIDGKPSSLTGADRSAILDQLPANAIESVELITNPSAKYDPDGTSGIINIVMKKNRQESFSGSVNANGGLRPKYGAGVNLNYRTKKYALSAGYNYRYVNVRFKSLNERKNSFSDTSFYFNQYGENIIKMNNHVLRFGVDYFLSKSNTLGISSTFSLNDRNLDGTNDYRNYGSNYTLSSLVQRLNESNEDGMNLDLGLNYKHSFSRPKQELSMEASYSTMKNNSYSDYEQLLLNLNGTPSGQNPFLQNMSNDADLTLASFRIDYTQPIGTKIKIETGYKSSLRNTDGNFEVDTFNHALKNWINDRNQSNRFIFNEVIHALYGNYNHTLGKFGFQLGLRVEQALTTADQRSTSQKVNRDYLSFFPSIYFSYKITEDQEAQINYSRRINRPNLQWLNPFTDYSDPQNLRTGNSYLKPEYVNSYELSYIKYFGKNSLTSTVYFRQTTDVIQRFRFVDTSGISTVTFQNFNNSRSYGFEFIAATELMKGWNLTSNINLFENRIDAANIYSELKNSGIGGSLKVTSMTRIPKVIDIQLSASYNLPINIAQGNVQEIYALDMGLKKDIWKNKGSVTFNITDIFNTRSMRINATGIGFEQYSRFKRDTFSAVLGLTYRFGKSDTPQRKKANRPDENTAPSMDGEGF